MRRVSSERLAEAENLLQEVGSWGDEEIEEFYSEIQSEKRQQWRDRIELEMEVREVE